MMCRTFRPSLQLQHLPLALLPHVLRHGVENLLLQRLEDPFLDKVAVRHQADLPDRYGVFEVAHHLLLVGAEVCQGQGWQNGDAVVHLDHLLEGFNTASFVVKSVLPHNSGL
jgi:hypothetical protein